MQLHLREFAEYTGDGTLLCAEKYGAELFVAVTDATALYSLEDAVWTAVVLPEPAFDYGQHYEVLGGPSTLRVEELLLSGGYLWALGWAGMKLRLGGHSAVFFTPRVWRYDGISWELYGWSEYVVTVPMWGGPAILRWANAVTTPEGIAYATWAQEPYTHLADIRGYVRDWALSTDEGRFSPARCQVWIPPNLLRMDHSATKWQQRVWYMRCEAGVQQLYWTRGEEAHDGPAWRAATNGLYHSLFAYRGALWLLGEQEYACWRPPRFVLGRSFAWDIGNISADSGDLVAVAQNANGEQFVLMELTGGPFLDLLGVEWGDGVGAHKPTLDSLAVEWGNLFPTELYLDRLVVEWGDGLGANKPLLDSLAFTWGDGHVLHQPTLERMILEWYWGADERPTLDNLTVEWGDGLGANQPTLDTLTLEWGDNSHGPNKPTLDTLTVGWAAHEPWPRRSCVQLDLFRLEWADNPQVLVGEKILWLLHTGETDAFEVRVTTEANIPDEAAMRCVIRCDQEALPVLAWSTYQTFALNENVSIEQPGKEVRVGIIKPDSVDDTTGVLVQLRRETQEE